VWFLFQRPFAEVYRAPPLVRPTLLFYLPVVFLDGEKSNADAQCIPPRCGLRPVLETHDNHPRCSIATFDLTMRWSFFAGVFPIFAREIFLCPPRYWFTCPRFLFGRVAVSALLNSIALVMIRFPSATRKQQNGSSEPFSCWLCASVSVPCHNFY
jgi:hypothetical protein